MQIILLWTGSRITECLILLQRGIKMVCVCDSATSDRLWLRSRYDSHTCHTSHTSHTRYTSHTCHAQCITHCTSHTCHTQYTVHKPPYNQYISVYTPCTLHKLYHPYVQYKQYFTAAAKAKARVVTKGEREREVKQWQTVARWIQDCLLITSGRQIHSLQGSADVSQNRAFTLWTLWTLHTSYTQ